MTLPPIRTVEVNRILDAIEGAVIVSGYVEDDEGKRHYDLVEITWVDASDMESGWTTKVKPEPALAMSAGYLVFQDKDHLVLAQDTDDKGEHNGRGQIPRGMVKQIKVIKKKDAID